MLNQLHHQRPMQEQVITFRQNLKELTYLGNDYQHVLGDIEKARELQTLSNDYITDLLNNDLYPTIKLVFEKLGVHAGYCKEPMSKPTPEMEAGAQKIYEKYFKK